MKKGKGAVTTAGHLPWICFCVHITCKSAFAKVLVDSVCATKNPIRTNRIWRCSTFYLFCFAIMPVFNIKGLTKPSSYRQILLKYSCFLVTFAHFCFCLSGPLPAIVFGEVIHLSKYSSVGPVINLTSLSPDTSLQCSPYIMDPTEARNLFPIFNHQKSTSFVYSSVPFHPN